jgi:hypothetical protein
MLLMHSNILGYFCIDLDFYSPRGALSVPLCIVAILVVALFLHLVVASLHHFIVEPLLLCQF